MPVSTIQVNKLEPLHVATVTINDQSPEVIAIQTLLDWARHHGLLDRPFRFFGYDSCLPYPDHTYTTLLTVDADVKSSDDIHIVDLPGGLFAVLDIQGVENISQGWRQLERWCKDSVYTFGDQTGLEEYVDVLSEQPFADMQFKLYLSIKE